MGFLMEISLRRFTQHVKASPCSPGFTASLRCVIATDKLPLLYAVPKPRQCLQTTVSRVIIVNYTCSSQYPSLGVELGGCLQRATCRSWRRVWRCSPWSSALLTVRLRITVQAARLANNVCSARRY